MPSGPPPLTPALVPPRGGPSIRGGEAGPFLGGPGIGLIGPGLPGYPGNVGPLLPGFVMPKILTPGMGPNGPQAIDSRKMLYSVGEGSTVPYGPTNGYAMSDHGVTGFIGPAAGSLQQPTAWYVRATGANTNGGTTNATTPTTTGTTGTTVSGSLTFTDASGAFTQAMVGQGICIQNASPLLRKDRGGRFCDEPDAKQPSERDCDRHAPLRDRWSLG